MMSRIAALGSSRCAELGFSFELRFSFRLLTDSHRLHPDRFALSFNATGGDVLQIISPYMGLQPHLVARLDKLNSFTTGGFFEAHQDTPKGDHHTDTLVVFLPSTFTGRVLSRLLLSAEDRKS